MTLIVITLPDRVAHDEAVKITAMLDSGTVDRVHIRKPSADPGEIAGLLEAIPARLHQKLSLHSCPQLLERFPGVGWHFSSRRAQVETPGLLSRSCHTPAEAAEWARRCDYVTLSPVFDSISKPGYTAAAFTLADELAATAAGNVIALGGVTPTRLPDLRQRGYRGAAMLGYAWATDFQTLINELKCYNS